MQNYSISAFFPVYNDAGTIELMINRLKQVLEETTKDYEIIIVNDGSEDNSAEIADQLAKKHKNIKVIHHEKNKGYGGALKTGFKNVTKDLVFYTDGDAQYNALELKRLLPHINDHHVVNGYKLNRGDGILRKILGTTYNHTVRFIFNLKVKDVDCDFRLMHSKIFKNINLKTDTGMICVEMMKKIENQNYKIKNIPVNHYPRTYGRSQFLRPKRVIKTMKGVLDLWVNLNIKNGKFRR